MLAEISFFLAGALGALVKDILVDGAIVLPERVDKKLKLGFLGGMIIGAFVGWAVDQSLITAAFAGFSGKQMIEKLLPKKEGAKENQ